MAIVNVIIIISLGTHIKSLEVIHHNHKSKGSTSKKVENLKKKNWTLMIC